MHSFAKFKITVLKLPKTFDILPKWRNFTTSGHTAYLSDVLVGGVAKASNDNFFYFLKVKFGTKFTTIETQLKPTKF